MKRLFFSLMFSATMTVPAAMYEGDAYWRMTN